MYKSYEFRLINFSFDGIYGWHLWAPKDPENELIAERLNFKLDKNDYHRLIKPEELDYAFGVLSFCEYKGEILMICNSDPDKKDTFIFDMRGATEAEALKFGLLEAYKVMIMTRYDDCLGMFMRVPETEILNVWEVPNPIDGFTFKGPEKVWIKKDGVWL